MKKAVLIVFILAVMFLGLCIKEASDSDKYQVNSLPAIRQTDRIGTLRDIKFKEGGYELKATGEAFKIDEAAAIKLARNYAGNSSKKAEAVRSVKGRLTNCKTPYIAGSDVVLNNYPVWIVTFHDVALYKLGGPVSSPDYEDTVQADQNVVVDAEKGEVLMSIAYSI